VLVRPRGGANVGAVCRAIKNMDGGRLVVVEGGFDVEAARIMAVHAVDVLEGRIEAPTLTDAVAGCGVVVGTTARSGAYRARSTDLRSLARDVVVHGELAFERPLALVFGPEDSGLSNEEISLCHRLAFIPTADAYTSLNLAQAVMVCLYELHLARLDSSGRQPTVGVDSRRNHPQADAGSIEAMLVSLEDALLQIGFLSDENPAHVMMSIRSLLTRGGLDEREVRILRGLARQIRWFADAGHEIAREKHRRGEKLR